MSCKWAEKSVFRTNRRCGKKSSRLHTKSRLKKRSLSLDVEAFSPDLKVTSDLADLTFLCSLGIEAALLHYKKQDN